jgi:diketogulonate reductase-like aldo/keto reductase
LNCTLGIKEKLKLNVAKHGIAIQGWGPFAKSLLLEDEELKRIAENYKKNGPTLCSMVHSKRIHHNS